MIEITGADGPKSGPAFAEAHAQVGYGGRVYEFIGTADQAARKWHEVNAVDCRKGGAADKRGNTYRWFLALRQGAVRKYRAELERKRAAAGAELLAVIYPTKPPKPDSRMDRTPHDLPSLAAWADAGYPQPVIGRALEMKRAMGVSWRVLQRALELRSANPADDQLMRELAS